MLSVITLLLCIISSTAVAGLMDNRSNKLGLHCDGLRVRLPCASDETGCCPTCSNDSLGLDIARKGTYLGQPP